MTVPSADVQALLSAIFIFIGASVFFISSLISGHNIFRDISYQMGLLVSTMVGFVLFAFSPISFLVLDPNLFGISGKPGEIFSTGELYVRVHAEIQQHLFLPFILSAVGLGAVFGGFEAINARTLFLHWLRRTLRLRYPILSYEKSWDNFMLGLKKGGRIKVMPKDDRLKDEVEDGRSCEGKLKSASIKDEPQQITLNCDGKYKLIEAGDIAYIEADKKSFNRHLDIVPHQAEALYLAIAALGLMLLAFSASFTAAYFTKYSALAALYHLLSLVLFFVATVFVAISYDASKQNFRHLSAYLGLCIIIPSFLLLEVIGLYFLFRYELFQLDQWPETGGIFPGFWWQVIVAASLLVVSIVYRWKKGDKVDGLINAVAGANNDEQKEQLKKVCEFIYLQVGLNRATRTKWSDLLKASREEKWDGNEHELLPRLHEKIYQLIQRETFLGVGPDMYLKNEDFNIVLRLLRKLEKDLDRIPAGLASGPDEPEGITVQTTEAEYVRVRYRRIQR